MEIVDSSSGVQTSKPKLRVVAVASGVVGGIVSFAVFSFLSLWSILGGESTAPIVVLVLGGALVTFVIKAPWPTGLALGGTMMVTMLLGFLVGLDGHVVGSLSLDPSALLLHGGHSGIVAVATGATVGAAFSMRSHRLAGTPSAE